MRFGQPLLVDNKTGAHGMIAAAAVKSAPPDGYTLLSSSSGPMSINPAVYKDRLSYDPLKDFVAVAPTMRGSLFLLCNNELPIRNLKDMIAWVRERPGARRISRPSAPARPPPSPHPHPPAHSPRCG